VTGDRGLCGAYNVNICRAAMAFAHQFSAPVKFIAVGRKGRDWLLRRRQTLIGEFTALPLHPDLDSAAAIGRLVMEDFLNGTADEVYLAYMRYLTTLRQETQMQLLLPLQHTTAPVSGTEQQPFPLHGVYSYEPSAEEVLKVIVPRFITLQVYQALLEARASEHAARMLAMHNASEAATALLNDLQLHYNKTRQLAITSEMLDIVGGVEALGANQ